MPEVRPILVPYHLNESIVDGDWPLDAQTTVDVDLDEDADRWWQMTAIYRHVMALVAVDVWAGAMPVVLSGDCTTSLGIVAGVQVAKIDPSIVWFDAHGDVQTLETTASGYIGGMPLRMLTG